MRTVMMAIAMLAATAAAAQVSVGNPPGNTLAPATGNVVTTPGPPAAAPTPDKTPAQTPAELAAIKYRTELVCKTSIETGSLIAKRKTCLTRKQWQYVNEQHEDEARKLMMDNMGKPTGN